MGSRRTGEDVERVYEAAEAWVDGALRADDSLFTPGAAIWSSRWLGELRERFLDQPDETRDSFPVKLQRQLAGSRPEVYQLMGEALFFYFLIVSTKSGTNEKRVIDTVLGWSPAPVPIPPRLVASLTPGIATPGQQFHSGRPFHVGFLIELAEQWREQEPSERDRLLGDPWAFKDFVMGIELRSKLLKGSGNRAHTQREALLHLVFPDDFEGIVNFEPKRMIAQAFKSFVTEPTDDVDRMLAQIRPRLEEEHGRGIHFYEDAIRRQWHTASPSNPNLWDDFVERAKAFYASGRLDSWEVDYKLDVGRKLAAAREAVLAGRGGWAELLKDALKPTEANFISWRLIANLNQWCAQHPDDALTGLMAIWAGDASSVSESIREFCAVLPLSVATGVGTRMNVTSALLMGLNAEQCPPFRVKLFNEACEATEYYEPEKDADEAALYEHALGFLDRFMEEAAARGLPMRHRLDAQSYVWGILKLSEEPPPETPAVAEARALMLRLRGRDRDRLAEALEDWEQKEMSESELKYLTRYIAKRNWILLLSGEPPPPTPPADPWAPDKVAALAGELLWEPRELQKIVDGLMDKRQVIFQGPPGTGKTYAAKRIAEWCKEHGGGFKVVQFHPSYSYEDFVEGYRPTLTDGGQAAFKLTEGPLRGIAKEAANNPDAPFILLIDEINRGNVAKVLGELYFLLEYRDEALELQYSHEPFSLPKNLWFIGTMNTTDRSIALVDAALRRRFYFFGFFPDKPPIEGLLKRWLAEHSPEAAWAAGLVDLANRKLEDQHLGIGPSYFMKKDPPLNENRVHFIWDQAVIPYIEEQCFGDEGKLGEFAYDRLKRELDGGLVEDAGQPEDGAGDAQD